MDSGSDGSDVEQDLGAFALPSELRPGGGLKPQMDDIFAEVAKSLPSINFDLSDVSSDSEEPIVIHRNIKSSHFDYDDDKDLDTSLSGESASDFFKCPLVHIPSVDKNNTSANRSSPMAFDNDLAALLAAQEGDDGEDYVSSWKDLERVAQQDKARQMQRNAAVSTGRDAQSTTYIRDGGRTGSRAQHSDLDSFPGISELTDMMCAQIDENNESFSLPKKSNTESMLWMQTDVNNRPSVSRTSNAESMLISQIEENNRLQAESCVSDTDIGFTLVDENSCVSSSARMYDSGNLMLAEMGDSENSAFTSLSGMELSLAAGRLLTQTADGDGSSRTIAVSCLNQQLPGISAAGRMLIAQIEENNRVGAGTRQGARTVDMDLFTNNRQRNNSSTIDFNHPDQEYAGQSKCGTDGERDSNKEAERQQAHKVARERKRLLDVEKQRAREKELALMYMSAKAPHLSMQILDSIDFDSALDTYNELDNVTLTSASEPSYPPRPAHTGPSVVSPPGTASLRGEGDGKSSPESDNLTLIQKLAKFSMAQGGQACDLSAIDPQTGAAVKIETSPVSAGTLSSVEVTKSVSLTGQEAGSGVSKTMGVTASSSKAEAVKPGGVQIENKWTVKSSTSTNTTDSDAPKETTTAAVSAGMTSLLETLAKRKPEPKTVFLDLRGFEQHQKEEQERMESVKRVLGLEGESKKPDSSNSDDDDADDDAWVRQRQKIKKTLSSRGTSTTPSFKQQRLKQTQPTRVINLPKRSSTKAISSAAPSVKTTSSCGVSTSTGTSTKKLTSAQALDNVSGGAGTRDSNQVTEEERLALLAREQEKTRFREAAKALREKQEKERTARQRMLHHLEGLRPTASVSGHQACADNTPVVFDLEASYEPRIPVLPTTLDKEELLLITVNLSSNGEIASFHSRGKGNSDSGAINTLPVGYTSLLCWLLTLIPRDFNEMKEWLATPDMFGQICPDAFPPFHVIGMQQLWVEEKLTLAIVVCPSVLCKLREVEKDELRNLKKVRKGEDKTTFHRFVSTFLSRNSLTSITCWPLYPHDFDKFEDTELDCPVTFRKESSSLASKPFSTYMQIVGGQEAVQKIFNRDVGFFWQTVDSHGPESVCQHGMKETEGDTGIQNTMFLLYQKALFRPKVIHDLLITAVLRGLDIAGLRVLYPTRSVVAGRHYNFTQAGFGRIAADTGTEGVNPILAMALRGPLARIRIMAIIGPTDYDIAKHTDPNSLNATFGTAREPLQIFCPRNADRVQSELARWFGGRVPDQGSIDVGLPYKRRDSDAGATNATGGKKKGKRSGGKGDEDITLEAIPSRPPAALTAATVSHVIMAMPPVVPPYIMGFLVGLMQQKAIFQPRGVRRMCLNVRRATALGIPSALQPMFLPGVNLDAAAIGSAQPQESTCPSTLLILERENVLHHASSLGQFLSEEISLYPVLIEGLQLRMQSTLEPIHLFHFADYSDSLVTALGGSFLRHPDFDPRCNHSIMSQPLYTNSELEQVVVLILLGKEETKDWGSYLASIQYQTNDPTVWRDFELLGFKWLPHLSPLQARELTPYEIGAKEWKGSVQFLSSAPAVVFALRGVNAFKRLEPFASMHDHIHSVGSSTTAVHISVSKAPHPTRLMSRNTEEAYLFLRMFFNDTELFPDMETRALLPFLPEARLYNKTIEWSDASGTPADGCKPQVVHKEVELQDQTQESVFNSLLCGPISLTSFLLIKPRAARKHLAKILRKVLQEGFTVVGLRMDMMEHRKAEQFLSLERVEFPKVYEHHLNYLTSDPCVYLAVSRENAVKKLSDVVGPEDPQQARRENQFYWRGIFGTDPVHNGVFASRTYFESVWDQKAFFPDGLCCDRTYDLEMEQIPCPAADSIVDVNFSTHRKAVRNPSIQSGDASSATTAEKVHSLLMQTTCLVLPPMLLRTDRNREAPFVEILNLLLSHGFELVGARMVWMLEQQAEQFLHIIKAGSFEKVSELTSNPCLILALQRDNAVLAFENTLGASVDSQNILSAYGKDMYRPADLKQAQQLLALFFDRLMPGSQMTIQPITHTVEGQAK